MDAFSSCSSREEFFHRLRVASEVRGNVFLGSRPLAEAERFLRRGAGRWLGVPEGGGASELGSRPGLLGEGEAPRASPAPRVVLPGVLYPEFSPGSLEWEAYSVWGQLSS